MPRFIPLNIFSSCYDKIDELFTDEGLQSFHEKIDQRGAELIADGAMNSEELAAFKLSVSSPDKILFHQWISANDSLSRLLIKGELEAFEDRQGITKHKLFSAFQSFVSPYLTERVLTVSLKDLTDRKSVFSYVRLLDEESRILVEDQLFKPIKTALEEMSVAAKRVVDEQELIELVKPLCTDDHIAIVNELSKSSYAAKLTYVDTILASLRSKACTVRLANWVLKSMELVQLNKEHEYKINDLRRALREGHFRVKNHGKGSTSLRRKDILLLISFLLVAGSVSYILYYKPFSQVNEHEFEDGSSFKEFTPDERRLIDSLVQTMDTQMENEELVIDPGNMNGGGISLSIRKPFRNKKLEAIYQDLSKDENIKSNYSKDSCAARVEPFTRYQGVTDPSKRNEPVSAVFRNESDYQVIIYIAEDKSSGVVTSTLLEQGKTVVLPVDYGDAILVVAGEHYTKFTKHPQAKAEELPSQHFTHHFCVTDGAYEETMNTAYKYSDLTRTKTKFMITGTKSTYVRLVDLFGVLSDY